ncbi:hypothetical protein J3459_006161 [Metarhizium acridum]|uniref:uncharacterized protein n=1 Tax=Metarhizium acridum TaxID=92637 RepID=UPI001C6B2CFA|nr:hypothetical protein J3458_005594 [Metarhizium acridum]KAG8427965.1 hypothetical protein J3459_006161 [Metarhizium acridum]
MDELGSIDTASHNTGLFLHGFGSENKKLYSAQPPLDAQARKRRITRPSRMSPNLVTGKVIRSNSKLSRHQTKATPPFPMYALQSFSSRPSHYIMPTPDA